MIAKILTFISDHEVDLLTAGFIIMVVLSFIVFRSNSKMKEDNKMAFTILFIAYIVF